SLQIVPGQLQARLSHLALGLSAVQLCLVGPRVDDNKQLALFDLGPVLKVNRIDVTDNAGPNLHHLDSLQMAWIFVPVGDHRRLGLSDRYFWNGSGGWFWRRTSAERSG